MSNRILDELQIVSAIVPVDLSTAANNGDWVSMANYQSCVCVLFKGAGTAGDDPIFKLQQATSAAGANAKDLNFTRIFSKVGTLTSIGAFTETTQTAATSYTDAVSAEATAIIAVEVSWDDLDIDNDFYFIQLSVADVGANAQLGCGLYLLGRPRVAGTPLVSAIA